MGVIVDTSLLIAFFSRDDPLHRRAKQIVREIVEGKHGTPFVTDYVLAELFNYTVSSRAPPGLAAHIAEYVLGAGAQPWLTVVNVDEAHFAQTAEIFLRGGSRRRLSFTDCASLVLAKVRGIGLVASFDRGFDGHLPRLC